MSKNLYILIISGMLSILSASGAFAQRLAVKSNLLADALASPNIEAELLVSPRWTLDFAAHYQPFAPRDNRRWKHWILQPEARRWLCTPFAGHFLGRRSASAFPYSERSAQGALRRLVFGRRHFVWISLGAFSALGHGSRFGSRGGLSPQRPLSLRPLRQQAAGCEKQGILRPYKGCRIHRIYD